MEIENVDNSNGISSLWKKNLAIFYLIKTLTDQITEIAPYICHVTNRKLFVFLSLFYGQLVPVCFHTFHRRG